MERADGFASTKVVYGENGEMNSVAREFWGNYAATTFTS